MRTCADVLETRVVDDLRIHDLRVADLQGLDSIFSVVGLIGERETSNATVGLLVLKP